jgi:hypothetical protein
MYKLLSKIEDVLKLYENMGKGEADEDVVVIV